MNPYIMYLIFGLLVGIWIAWSIRDDPEYLRNPYFALALIFAVLAWPIIIILALRKAAGKK